MLYFLNRIIWSTAFVFLIGSGLYFSIKLRFKQFDIVGMVKSFRKSDGSSPFSSLTMSLGARIGVGSLAGVALAMKLGGIGSIFWIWVSSLTFAIISYVESYLSVKYKKGNVGGPSFYIRDGLGSKKLSFCYAFIIIIAYIFGFLTIQSNTITRTFSGFGISPIIVSLIISISSTFIIFKGSNRIISFTTYLVPIMCLIYAVTGIYIIINNISIIPGIIASIISSAFNYKALGFGVITSLIVGVQRGIFSTEAGIGTSAIASSSSDSNDANRCGLVQVVGVYFTSLVICTITALIILTSNYSNLFLDNINGIEVTFLAFNYHLGNIGNIILVISIILFSFSTIIAGYYYGESNMRFVYNSKKLITLLKIGTVFLLFIGGLVSATVIWSIVDILVGILLIINVSSIFLLKNEVCYNEINKKK